MGTSRNDPSPRIPPWEPVRGILGRQDIEPERQALEVWRAAIAERGLALTTELSDAAVLYACSLASTGLRPGDALAAFNSTATELHAAGFGVELAKRALGRVRAADGDRVAFASELFAEATNYYVSRDLCSFVGKAGRLSSVAGLHLLKATLCEITRKKVLAVGVPPLGRSAWRSYVKRVLGALTAREVA